MKRKLPGQVLKELDKAFLDTLDKIRSDGVGPTEAQKKIALKLMKQDPGYAAIAKKVERGSDDDLEEAKKIIREQFPSGFRKPLLQAAKALPFPKGGRPRLLSDPDKSKACDQIIELIRTSGLDTPDAIQQVAARFGVRLRTMQRVWQGRANFPKKPKS